MPLQGNHGNVLLLDLDLILVLVSPSPSLIVISLGLRAFVFKSGSWETPSPGRPVICGGAGNYGQIKEVPGFSNNIRTATR
jgi:hypothetical protein